MWAPYGGQQQPSSTPPAGYGAQPVAPPAGYGAQPAPPYGLQPVGYEQLPPPQQMPSLQQLAISQAKSEATFVIVFAVIGFFTTPLLFLAAAWARGQRLCRRVREIGAPADVVTKAHIARGIAVGGFALQVVLIAALIISENLCCPKTSDEWRAASALVGSGGVGARRPRVVALATRRRQKLAASLVFLWDGA